MYSNTTKLLVIINKIYPRSAVADPKRQQGTASPLLGPISFIFMQFSAKSFKKS